MPSCLSLIVPARATLYFIWGKTLFRFNKASQLNCLSLFDRDTFCQIPWLIHIRAAQHCNMIRQELQWNRK
jgi:hypothetical protein